MLTTQFYAQLALLLKNGSSSWGPLSIAIGSGAASWDRSPPLLRREQNALVAELTRKNLSADDWSFVDDAGADSVRVSAQLRATCTFLADEGTGTLRECGLFGGASGTVLLAYFIHPRVEKIAATSLHRNLRLDLRPGRAAPSEMPTRYLGNSYSEELHDLDNEKTSCQLNELRIDRRHFFTNIDQALNLGYDYCAYCFGRELSQR
jgi:hypothetical protein